MSVWLTLPSARPVAEVNVCMDAWRDMGYRIALWRDFDPGASAPPKHDLLMGAEQYPGYSQTVNALTKRVFELDSDCDWCVAAGDDTAPDANKRADEIAAELSLVYGCKFYPTMPQPEAARMPLATFGVMQPTGDPWSDRLGRIIERIAGSPWLGREWCRRANGGRGPLWPDYTHCFADEELQCVAQRLGVFWQRPDLTHMHDNWARARGNILDRPDFLIEATSPEHWRKYSALFKSRKEAGFPGSEPIA